MLIFEWCLSFQAIQYYICWRQIICHNLFTNISHEIQCGRGISPNVPVLLKIMPSWASFVHKSVCMFIVSEVQSLQNSLSFRMSTWILNNILWGGIGSGKDLRVIVAIRTAIMVVMNSTVIQAMIWSALGTPEGLYFWTKCNHLGNA